MGNLRRTSFTMTMVCYLLGCAEHDSATIRRIDSKTESAVAYVETNADTHVREIASRFSIRVADNELGAHVRAPFADVPNVHLALVGQEHLRAEWSGRKKSRMQIQLPAVASGRVLLEDLTSGISVGFSLLDMATTRFEPIRGGLLFRQAQAGAFDVLHFVRPNVVEDFVYFDHEPAREQIRYDIDVSAVAGLRLVGNSVEFLDAGGAPRLRVTQPWLVDSRGKFIRANLDVVAGADGRACAVDRTAALPWGRVPTPPCHAPGTCHCELEVSWEKEDVEYPALLDPSWSTTGDMAETRREPVAIHLASDRILVTAGDPADARLATDVTEVFDGKTETWATVANMSQARHRPAMSSLSDGQVLVAGGRIDINNATTSVEIYDPKNNQWEYTTPLDHPRCYATATRLLDDRILLAGGVLGASPSGPATTQARLFNPDTKIWTPIQPTRKARMWHTATRLQDGRVVLIGGETGDEKLDSAEIFMPESTNWELLPIKIEARAGHSATLLPDGSIVICGGLDRNNKALATCEKLYEETQTWKQTALVPTMKAKRVDHAALLLLDGRIFVTGGHNENGSISSAEIWAPKSNEWLGAGTMLGMRTQHMALQFAPNKILAAGGYDGDTAIRTAEVFSFLGAGVKCEDPGECESSLCANGVCCDQPCPGPCYACTHADKGSGPDGVCEKVPGDHCEGHYECVPPSEGGACKTSCLADADCAGGFACNESSHECVPNTQWYCVNNISTPADDHMLAVNCHAYLCVDGNCNTTCIRTADCAPNASCNVEQKTCVPLAPSVDNPSGCTCAWVQGPRQTSAVVLLGFTCTLLGWRRIRRQRRTARLS